MLPHDSSVNRVVIRNSGEWEGAFAGDILGRDAWRRAVIAAFPALEQEADPLLALQQTSLGTDAESLVGNLALRIAALLETLRNGSPQSRLDRPSWNDDAWEFWRTRETLVFGGGLMSGELGKRVVAACQVLLPPEIKLVLAEFPRYRAVIGASRTAPVGAASVLALDLGQTGLKRALAQVSGSDIVAFTRYPSLPVDDVLDAVGIVGLINDAADNFDGTTIRISVASYIDQSGCPSINGFVGRLHQLSEDVPGYLAQAFTNRLGHPVDLRLLHDGTAGALGFAGLPRSAFIAFGTAMGIGVPPSTQNKLLGWKAQIT